MLARGSETLGSRCVRLLELADGVDELRGAMGLDLKHPGHEEVLSLADIGFVEEISESLGAVGKESQLLGDWSSEL
jgi:hypothetical protein